ncbi:MAG TPA: hypothetical protein VEC02_06645 [Nitrososphaerales archaeon]|nr:hypothetical protein [Nitrososphaerales archaeon]
MVAARAGGSIEGGNQRNLTIRSRQGAHLGRSKAANASAGSETAPSTQPSNASDIRFKALVVATILDSRPEEAISILSDHYHVTTPRISVGVFEGKTKGVAAVYSVARREILAARREYLYDPFVIIHEFYHHLRSTSGRHKGTERQADEFAADYIRAYQSGTVAFR